MNDTTHTRAPQEGLAATAAAASGDRPAPSAARRASGDSIALYYAVADSADSLDTTFQRARAALNAEARTFIGADRRSRDYVARYTAYEARRDSAEALRARRDRLRARRDALRARLGSQLQAPTTRP